MRDGWGGRTSTRSKRRLAPVSRDVREGSRGGVSRSDGRVLGSRRNLVRNAAKLPLAPTLLTLEATLLSNVKRVPQVGTALTLAPVSQFG